MKKSTPSENSRSLKSCGFRSGLFAIFAGILSLGVFAPEKTLGADKIDSDEEFVLITRFKSYRFAS